MLFVPPPAKPDISPYQVFCAADNCATSKKKIRSFLFILSNLCECVIFHSPELIFARKMANHAIKAKHTIGTVKPTAIRETSAILPIITGQTAPPTIVITSTEEPFFVMPPKVF
jgi:hypothetical protein